MKKVTFNRVQNGVFEILVDGVKNERWEIVNGCAGLSGRDTPNIYVLCKDDLPTKIQGSLQMCKKAAVQILSRLEPTQRKWNPAGGITQGL
jgi:hypothetical protein